MKKLFYLLLLPLYLNATGQDIKYFSPGPVAAGTIVKDAYGVVWKAKTKIANAVSPPSANAYWSYVKTVSVPNFDTLQAKITQLEIKVATPVVTGPTTTAPPTVDTTLFPAIKTPVIAYPRTAGQTITPTLVANGSTNNATALNSLSSSNKWSNTFKDIVVPGASAQTNYSDNTWIEGLWNFRLRPTSGIAKLYNTGGNEFDISHQPLVTSAIFNYDKKASYVGTINTGYLFSTATAGASSITASGTGLTAGDRVFLAGYETQGYGWPPNPRFFEWKTVLSVVGTTITFTKPLEESYNANWKDWDWGGGYFFGKPRIYKIPANYARYVELKDIDWLIQGDVGNAFQLQADTLIIENNTFHGGIWPSENQLFKCINCSGGSWEGDKAVGTLELRNLNTQSEMQGFTGVKWLRMYGGEVNGYMAVTPRFLHMEGVNLKGGLAGIAAIYPFEYYTGVDTWYFKNNIFPNSQTAFDVVTKTFTVESVSGGNRIVLPDNSDPNHAAHWPTKLIVQGSTIWRSGGSARVVDIEYVSGKYHLVLDNIVGSLSAGQVWSYRQIKNIVDLGGNRKENGTPITLSLPALP